MSAAEESVILCEGFHDRAFWAGLLERKLGCTDARPKLANGNLGTAMDPFLPSSRVVGGDFAFLTPSGAFLRIRPCHGDSKVLAMTTIRLKERTTKALRYLIVNLDVDPDDDDVARAKLRAERIDHRVEQLVAAVDPSAKRRPDGDIEVDGGTTLVSTVLWSTQDPAAPELPAKDTLERLVCAALHEAYPDRSAAVAGWLANRPSPPPPSAKDHAWSHMAGWYGAKGCDEFYQALWDDGSVAAQLEKRLVANGSWRVIEAIAR